MRQRGGIKMNINGYDVVYDGQVYHGVRGLYDEAQRFRFVRRDEQCLNT